MSNSISMSVWFKCFNVNVIGETTVFDSSKKENKTQ